MVPFAMPRIYSAKHSMRSRKKVDGFLLSGKSRSNQKRRWFSYKSGCAVQVRHKTSLQPTESSEQKLICTFLFLPLFLAGNWQYSGQLYWDDSELRLIDNSLIKRVNPAAESACHSIGQERKEARICRN